VNVSFWVFYFVARQYLDEDLGAKLTGISRFIASGVKGDYLVRLEPGDEDTRTYRNLHAKLDEARKAFSLNDVLLVDLEKHAIIDAGRNLRIGDEVFLLETAGDEIAKALEGIASASVVYRGEDGKLYKSGYAPVRNSRGDVVCLLVAEASAAFLGELETFRNLIVFITLVSVSAVLVLSVLLSRFVASPILRLAAAARGIREGKYSVLSSPGGKDEIGYLVEAFNEMAESIRENEEKLKSLYKTEAERAGEARRYVETILGSIATGIVSVDGRGIVRVCNGEACRIFGVDASEVIGMHYLELDCLRPFRDLLEGSLSRGEVARERPLEYDNAEGRRFHLGVSVSPSNESREESIAGNMVLTDHSELVRLQEEVKQKATLAAVGELAAHVAHEVRNPLGSIKIYIDLLAREQTDEAKRNEFIAKISSEVSRLNGIVTSFLQYSSPLRLEFSEFTLADVIKDAVLFARREEHFDRIRIEERYGGLEDLRINADRNQLMQLFLNLIRNACEAITDGGQVEVAMKLSGDAGREEPGKRAVVVSIRDTGQGIDPRTLSKIFTPFFTTKAHGTGLGLALAKRIVENHGGRVEIESNPGEGTTVFVTLPLQC
jgi:PAS domain S-box-containing protein